MASSDKRPPMRLEPVDRILLGILALVLLLLGLIGAAAFQPPFRPEGAPEIPGMLVRPETRESVPALAWAFGLAVFAVLASVVALGLSRGGRWGGRGRSLGAVVAAYGAVWVVLALLETLGLRGLLGSLPAPTAVLVYGVWPLPVALAWIWFRAFDGWVWTRDDSRRLESIREARR